MNDLTIYDSIRPQMKTGDGLGFQNVSIISKLIMWKTKNEGPIQLSHWGGIIRLPQYEQERRYTVEAESDGFQLMILSNYIKEYPGHIYWYPLNDEWELYRDQIGTDILSMIGTGYDFLGALKSGLGKCNADVRHLFCSEGWQIGYQNTAPQFCNYVGGRALVPAAMWSLGCFKNPVKII
ncbi:MAG: hypothetical protein IMZ53_13190 [Thermoplasmata archaeon]|nr:hypothetical protein [Thermoplasmata archaeon]